MSNPWLHIIGMGDNGLASLSPDARAAIDAARLIIGGKRHLDLIGDTAAEQQPWPSPFDHLIDLLRTRADQPTVILVSGDPLWHSAGSKIAASFTPDQLTIHPQLSAFQLAAARMQWRFDPANCLTLHGRDHAQLNRHLIDGSRLLVLTSNGPAVSAIAHDLTQKGFGESKLTALCHLGGALESRFEAVAKNWDHGIPDLNTLAIEVIGKTNQSLTSASAGRPDDLFMHDGKITKSVIRAATLAKLAPQAGELLWDIGLGSGAVAIEWLRAGNQMRAIGIDHNADRLAMATQNAARFGVPELQIITGKAPSALAGLAQPNAVFLGGGISAETIKICLEKLALNGRLVANAVTLESEQILLSAFQNHGGALERIQTSKADPVGHLTGWRPAMPVTQWSITK